MPKLAAALTPKSLKGAIDRFEKSSSQKKRIADGGCTGLELLLKRTNDGISKRWTFRAKVEGRAYDRSLYGLTYPECGINGKRLRPKERLREAPTHSAMPPPIGWRSLGGLIVG